MDLKEKIRVIDGFPKEGISFKDITTLLNDKDAYKYAVDLMVDDLKDKGITAIAAVDDLLATGGTVNAVAKLIEKNGGEITAMEFLIELTELGGRDINKNYYINTLVQYES